MASGSSSKDTERIRPSDRIPPTRAGNRPLASADDETLGIEGQLVEILDRYLADLKAGEAPNREELVSRHPHLAEQLEACLAGLEFIHRAESAGPTQIQRLGDFRLLREVERGGMGVVFEAEQVSLHSRVAVPVALVRLGRPHKAGERSSVIPHGRSLFTFRATGTPRGG